jgi:hypothetical protein
VWHGQAMPVKVVGRLLDPDPVEGIQQLIQEHPE